MVANSKELSAHAEGIRGATDLRELGAALVEAATHFCGASSVCFLPLGRGLSDLSAATLFHERHSREHMLEQLVTFFPLQNRELGCGQRSATERLFESQQRVVDLNALFGPEGLERTQTFNELWRPCHIERQLFAPLAAGKNPLGYLCLGRTTSDGAFRAAELERADWLSRQTLEAVRRLRQAESDSAELVLGALRGIPLPCAVFEASGALLWISEVAERMLGVQLDGVGRIWIVAENARLLEWQEAAHRALRSGSGVSLDGHLSLQRLGHAQQGLMLVTEERSAQSHIRRIDSLRSRWQLTAREVDVLMELARGRSNKEVGSSLGCSIRTVEVHVSSLLRKSGCASRTELLARLWAAS